MNSKIYDSMCDCRELDSKFKKLKLNYFCKIATEADDSRPKKSTMWPVRRLIKYFAFAGGTLGTLPSLQSNQYNFDSIGVVRLARAAATVLSITLLYKSQLYSTNMDENTQEYLELRSLTHKAAAEMLLALCNANRGVYIKVGQHIGALDYVLPQEYVDTMKVLQSRAPKTRLEDLFQVVREDMKKDVCELFSCFEATPLGTASLAQVHRAVRADGRVVAVKVQHPHVRANSAVDMATMEVLARLVSWTFPDFKFEWLVEEFKVNIPEELDFTREARNSAKVAGLFAKHSWLRVPAVHWDLTSPRVLTMEYLPGGQVDDLEYIRSRSISATEVSEKLGRLYSDMIFIHGFVHSDPHPGNILVHKPAAGAPVEIVLLDHGLYADLSNDFRWEYSKLWLSILNRDEAGIRRHGENLGVGELYYLLACLVTGRLWSSIVSGVPTTKATAREKADFKEAVPHELPKVSDVLTRVNRQVLLLLKTNDLLRSIERTLGTEYRMSSFLVMSRCCVKSVYSERLKACTTRLCRWRTRLEEHWALLKLWLYHVYLHATNFLHHSWKDDQATA